MGSATKTDTITMNSLVGMPERQYDLWKKDSDGFYCNGTKQNWLGFQLKQKSRHNHPNRCK
jgi:hypothetical protein